MDYQNSPIFEQYQNNPLLDIQTQFTGTSVNPSLLNSIVNTIKKSKTLSDLHSRTIESIHRLNSLDIFKTCDIEIDTAGTQDSALVKYHFKDLNWWNMSLGWNADNEGGKAVLTGLIRNLRKKADFTYANIEYKYNTGTWGYQISHDDNFFIPNKWQLTYNLRKHTEEIDTNFSEQAYGGSIVLKDFERKHQFEVGRFVRTNQIDLDCASEKLISLGVPVTSKNYVKYEYVLDERDDEITPREGFHLKVVNEVAYGKDAEYWKLDFIANKFSKLTENIIIQGTFNYGEFLYTKKVGINDLYRLRFVKGFRSLGIKEERKLEEEEESQNIGDNLGNSSFLSLEGRLHFYETSVLREMGISPFVYGNLICLEPSLKVDEVKEKVRGSVGFGLGWNSSFGRLEFSFASKVWTRPGDISAEFQILFGG